MRWERGEVLTGFWWRKLTETVHLEDLSVDGRIMSKCIFKKWDGVHWIELAHDRDRQGALVNAVMNLRFP
jgi:hypothetical protein